eukprot:UN29864
MIRYSRFRTWRGRRIIHEILNIGMIGWCVRSHIGNGFTWRFTVCTDFLRVIFFISLFFFFVIIIRFNRSYSSYTFPTSILLFRERETADCFPVTSVFTVSLITPPESEADIMSGDSSSEDSDISIF